MKELRTQLLAYAKSLGIEDDHVAETIVHDALIGKKNVEFRAVKYGVMNYFNREYKYERRDVRLYDTVNDDGTELIELISRNDLNELAEQKVEDQRQLIFQLIEFADSRTKQIVATWLSIESPNVTSVARALGIDRSTVNTTLRRLRKTFETSPHFEDKYSYFS